MKKVFITLTAFLWVLSNSSIPVLCAELPIESITDIPVQESSVHTSSRTPEAKDENVEEEELMFAPITLKIEEGEKVQNIKKFKLRAEVEAKQKPNKLYRQTWDDSKLYRYLFFSDEKNLRPLIAPASLGSYMEVSLDDNTSAFIGQGSLSIYDGSTLSFISKRESDYDVGGKVMGSMGNLNYSVGAYTDTNSLYNSLGGIVSTKPQKIWNSKGDFTFGTALYSNDYFDYNRNTAGFFTKYRQGKFTISGQLAQSTYTNNQDYINSAHFQTQYKLNDYLAFKSKIIKELNTDYAQDEYALKVTPMGQNETLNFELSASNIYNAQDVTRQRFKFTTNVRF